jgi:hypothetical protein
MKNQILILLVKTLGESVVNPVTYKAFYAAVCSATGGFYILSFLQNESRTNSKGTNTAGC